MISALVLAAGRSTRMGRPKMSLAWGDTTVLGNVIDVFHLAGVQDVLVVSGADRVAVEEIAAGCGARTVFNPDYAAQEMLSSIRAGLRAMLAEAEAAFIGLGDQPQMLPGTVRLLADEFSRGHAALVVPSYQMRRGHPWLVGRTLWNDLASLQAPETPRDFLRAHAGSIVHIDVDTPTILADLDTPEDYLKSGA